MEQAALISIVIFVVVVIFNAGRVSSRLDRLEQWREEARDELRRIADGVQHLERLMRKDGD